MPHVKNWIAEHGDAWLPKLVETYKINAVTAGELVSLKYDQTESPMHEPIVQECRGMVVHVPTGEILAHPYNKFWNLGDHGAAAIDWSTARVQDKLDGSLMILYWFDGDWRVASSGQPVAGGSYGQSRGVDYTFADAFWDVWHSSGMTLPTSPDQCYMFELVAPDNRIVCKYDEARLVLHGARNLRTEKEPCRGWLEQAARSANWHLVGEYAASDPALVTEKADALDPTKSEGFVVVDANFNRVKVKSKRYVALHHLRGNGSTNRRRAIDLWKAGEVGELLLHFPEMTADVQPVLDALDVAAERAYKDTLQASGLATRKDFAMAVKDAPWSAVCFRLYGGDSPLPSAATTILRGMATPALERIVDSILGAP